MLHLALPAVVVFAGFLVAGVLATRVVPVAGLAILFGAAWMGTAGHLHHGLLSGALPALLGVLTADALRVSAVVRLPADDRHRPVELLGEHHPRELVG